MEETQGTQRSNIFEGMKTNLPNATGVLVLGIMSIVSCLCYGLPGVICGVIAMVLAGNATKAYNLDPERYTASSLSNVKAGRICAIIGLSLSAICLLIVVVFFAKYGSNFMEQMNQYKATHPQP